MKELLGKRDLTQSNTGGVVVRQAR